MTNNYFLSKHGYFIEDLKIGQEANYEKKILEKDIMDFSLVTGDSNPVHMDDKFAKHTLFKKRIAHGFLSASLISTVIATKLPGPGSVYLNQTLKFLAPVFIGDLVNAKVKVGEINLEKNRINLLTECFIAEKRILTGNAEILVTSKADLK
jgi:3-hydroxybutyryl-CoA dehydratase